MKTDYTWTKTDILEKLKFFLRKIKSLFFSFLYYKIVLILLYFVGGYQSFAKKTMDLILRLLVINDCFLLFFSLSMIAYTILSNKDNFQKILFYLLAAANILFSIVTILFAFVIIVFN